MSPLLTIVTITRNDPAGLAATLASAGRLRERTDIETIVIDGNDGEVPPVQPLAGVHVVHRDPLGVSDAFNVGLSAANGEWIWFLNGGDTLHPEVDFEFVVRALVLTKADAIIFDIEREDGISYRPTLSEVWPPVFNWIPHPATFVRTKLVRDAGGFSGDYRIAADMDLWFRLFSRDAMVDLIHHRVTQFAAGGISSANPVSLHRENLGIIWAHRGRICSHLVRQILLVPYCILFSGTTVLLGKTPRWLLRSSY
jgi:glycosyltransferase involved in cell wall biosynthesis